MVSSAAHPVSRTARGTSGARAALLLQQKQELGDALSHAEPPPTAWPTAHQNKQLSRAQVGASSALLYLLKGLT